jgi:streptomycin 6-kinase
MMEAAIPAEVSSRVAERIAAWRVVVERFLTTETSILAFGWRDQQPVVLKVIKNPGDEWQSGSILDAFEGRGVVRVHEHIEGAMLLERLIPGESLRSMVVNGADDDATRVLAETIHTMSPRTPEGIVPTARDWARAFESYAASGDGQIPGPLLQTAHRTYMDLCDSQSHLRLLHGDLHHYNVLFDAERGWIAIDPKGVMGELEFEVGAALRNPVGSPELFAAPSIIRRRVERLGRELDLDETRILRWAYAQAVLAAIWAIEDGMRVEDLGWIALADALRPMVH